MTGSGSALFGVFKTTAEAIAAGSIFEESRLPWLYFFPAGAIKSFGAERLVRTSIKAAWPESMEKFHEYVRS